MHLQRKTYSLTDRVHVQGHGIRVHNEFTRRRKPQLKYQVFYFEGKHSLVGNPSDIKGVDRLPLREEPFDVFIHTCGADKSREDVTQLWVWEPLKASGTASGYGWKPVNAGYICPGPGGLEGRHLVMTNGKPLWLLGSTVYRHHKKVHPYNTTAPELGQ